MIYFSRTFVIAVFSDKPSMKYEMMQFLISKNLPNISRNIESAWKPIQSMFW